eukprot:sb/3474243/
MKRRPNLRTSRGSVEKVGRVYHFVSANKVRTILGGSDINCVLPTVLHGHWGYIAITQLESTVGSRVQLFSCLVGPDPYCHKKDARVLNCENLCCIHLHELALYDKQPLVYVLAVTSRIPSIHIQTSVVGLVSNWGCDSRI